MISIQWITHGASQGPRFFQCAERTCMPMRLAAMLCGKVYFSEGSSNRSSGSAAIHRGEACLSGDASKKTVEAMPRAFGGTASEEIRDACRRGEPLRPALRQAAAFPCRPRVIHARGSGGVLFYTFRFAACVAKDIRRATHAVHPNPPAYETTDRLAGCFCCWYGY